MSDFKRTLYVVWTTEDKHGNGEASQSIKEEKLDQQAEVNMYRSEQI